MRTFLSFFSLLFLLVSCKDTVITEPKNLIPEDKMVNIIYDLSLLEGVKSYNSTNFRSLKSNDFVYKKYNIDSLQFAKSTQFYASDIDKYKKIYDEVGKRIEKNKANVDSLISKGNQNKKVLAPINKEEQIVK